MSRWWLGHGILIHCIYFRNNAKNSQQKRSERRDGQKFIESKCSFWESSQEIVEELKRIIFQYFNNKKIPRYRTLKPLPLFLKYFFPVSILRGYPVSNTT